MCEAGMLIRIGEDPASLSVPNRRGHAERIRGDKPKGARCVERGGSSVPAEDM